MGVKGAASSVLKRLLRDTVSTKRLPTKEVFRNRAVFNLHHRSCIRKEVSKLQKERRFVCLQFASQMNTDDLESLITYGLLTQAAESMEKPRLSELFKDVYDQPTQNLREQEIVLRETIERHPKDYPSDVPL